MERLEKGCAGAHGELFIPEWIRRWRVDVRFLGRRLLFVLPVCFENTKRLAGT